ncbi:MAG TPA: sporulation protein YqfC [Bacillales bacterium]|nr:sporulation protein YqfC [Bacillales bacterium]
MSKWKDKLKNWLVKNVELPADVIMDLPRITIIGQLHIYIENHNGVLSFSNDEVRLRLTQGQLVVKGREFVLKTILPEEILLEGKIEQVKYLETL